MFNIFIGIFFLLLGAINIHIGVKALRGPSVEVTIEAEAAGEQAEATRRRITEAATATAGTFIIHEPEAGCPEGWRRFPDIFTNIDTNATSSGCVLQFPDPQPVHVDYIAAREKVGLPFVFELPLPEPKPNGI
jgi:hypothetical protein